MVKNSVIKLGDWEKTLQMLNQTQLSRWKIYAMFLLQTNLWGKNNVQCEKKKKSKYKNFHLKPESL